MKFQAIDPSQDVIIQEYEEDSEKTVLQTLALAQQTFFTWSKTDFKARSSLMNQLAELLKKKEDDLAHLITREIGKPIRQSRAEVLKCASVCEYYAEKAEDFLKPEMVKAGGRKSYIVFEPLGVILGIMPWNFPFWQVFRFLAPTIMAGNAAILKHSSNVPGCSLMIAALVREAGFPEYLFNSLLISTEKIPKLIDDARIKAVTLTGSEQAGMTVASQAGKQIKKTVMELGGSDPFIILDDADFDASLSGAIAGRMINGGQSCIASKRFIVTQGHYDHFCDKLREKLAQMKIGDPREEETELGPMAKKDLVDTLEKQVKQSTDQGAQLLYGGKRLQQKGFFFPPTLLIHVKKGMAVYEEETFGPIFAVIKAENTEEAIKIANDTTFGLAASLWTTNLDLAQELARKIEAGSIFINAPTVSNVHLPFGGIKRSGYGRELSHYGIKEFVNIKSIFVA